jgi:hypothetical protein
MDDVKHCHLEVRPRSGKSFAAALSVMKVALLHALQGTGEEKRFLWFL